MGFHQALAAPSRAALEVGVARGAAVVGAHDRFRRVRRQMDGAVTKVQDRVEVVIREGRARLGAAVVSRVRVRDRISLGEPMVGEVELPIFAAVADVEEASIPVRGKRKLHMKPDPAGDRALDVAVLWHVVGRGLQRCKGDREIRHRGEPLARGLGRERGPLKRLRERSRARIARA